MTIGADAPSLTLHASCVAWADNAVLITGASGQGKSTLALELMAYGAVLVADDRTILHQDVGGLIASAPNATKCLVEARHIGLLAAETVGDAQVTLVVDLDHIEDQRLPPRRSMTYIGVNLPLIYGSGRPGFAAAVLQYLKAGRSA